jgi:hypothetical protein
MYLAKCLLTLTINDQESTVLWTNLIPRSLTHVQENFHPLLGPVV